jgi:two-component sensor histidine kinase
VYESMHQALTTGDTASKQPIDEQLYAVYEITLKRNLPGFWTIKTFIPPDFTPLKTCPLDVEQKQGLCLFLEEALCNVGKHAVEATYLDVACKFDNNHYSLQIVDNGTQYFAGLKRTENGQGTNQARELARSLKGSFERRLNQPQGTVCELTWELRQPWWQFITQRLVSILPVRRSSLRKQKSDQEPPEF